MAKRDERAHETTMLRALTDTFDRSNNKFREHRWTAKPEANKCRCTYSIYIHACTENADEKTGTKAITPLNNASRRRRGDRQIQSVSFCRTKMPRIKRLFTVSQSMLYAKRASSERARRQLDRSMHGCDRVSAQVAPDTDLCLRRGYAYAEDGKKEPM